MTEVEFPQIEWIPWHAEPVGIFDFRDPVSRRHFLRIDFQTSYSLREHRPEDYHRWGKPSACETPLAQREEEYPDSHIAEFGDLLSLEVYLVNLIVSDRWFLDD